MKEEKKNILRFLKCAIKEEERRYSQTLLALRRFIKNTNYNDDYTEEKLIEDIEELKEHRSNFVFLEWLYWMVDDQNSFLSDDEIYGKL